MYKHVHWLLFHTETEIVVARVRTNKLDSPAYKDAFQAIFSKVKEYHPDFEVGKTLNGIICDWSDTQLKGIEQAVGLEVANRVVKGCQVQYFVMDKL